ncbi:MAG: FAD-dependent oxidoreductase [Vicinamibacterales bacterium]
MVGDRIYTDIAHGAPRATPSACSCSPAKPRPTTPSRPNPPPDLVVPSLAELGDLLARRAATLRIIPCDSQPNDAHCIRTPDRRNLSTLLVIGGGIVGAASHATPAMRGLRVGLVDRHDFASGTSSRSSRLLHGGLRYLEQARRPCARGQRGKEDHAQDRAASRASRSASCFPPTSGEGRPMWQLRIGVKLYDLLCGGRNFEPSRGFSATGTRQCCPSLKPTDSPAPSSTTTPSPTTPGSCSTPCAPPSATARRSLNYTRFHDATRAAGEHLDLPNPRPRRRRTAPVRARTLVNATGPWADPFRTAR